MKKQIFFDTNNFTTYPCVGKAYLDFIDYAFEKTDYFMLVYINWYGKGYSKSMKHFRDALKKYKVKGRINPKWPGTPYSYSNGTTYKVIFYRVCEEAKAILK